MTTIILQPKAIAIAGQAQPIAITGQGRPTYLVSQNKYICVWHQRLAHASKVRLVRVAKIMDNINLEQEDQKYDPAEVTFDLDDSDALDYLNIDETPMQLLAKTST